MPPSHGRALFALLLMSALSPARAANGDEKSLQLGWLWWLVMIFVAAVSCFLGHWLTRRRNTPIVKNLTESIQEAVKLRDEALDSMILYRQRAIENQKAAREQRIANELVLQELDQARSKLQELQQRQRQSGPPLTPQEEADRRIAAESHYRETLLDAKGLLQRCWREMVEHSRTCPMRDEVFMGLARSCLAPQSGLSSAQPTGTECPSCELYCTTCAAQAVPPDVHHAESRRTLNEDLHMFFTHHGIIHYEDRTSNQYHVFQWMHGWPGPWPPEMQAAGLVPPDEDS